MIKHHYIIIDIFFFLILILSPDLLSALEKNKDYLPEVVVESEGSILTKSNRIDSNVLKQLPLSNSSINEAVKLLPQVRAANKDDSALNQGEILPDKISISGGQFYDNNFNLDGSRFESWLNPALDTVNSITEIPGYTTTIFPGTQIIKSIEVLDSNIPAKYGGFTGGVVNSKTKDPTPQFCGSTQFMATRSEWTNFHLKDSLKYDFQNSRSQNMQPDFEKYDSNFLLQGPITKNSGYIFSYRNLRSKIPLYHLDSTKSQERNLDFFYLKLSKDHNLCNKSVMSVNYTPYKADYFMPDALNSDFSITGGGLLIGLEQNIGLKNSEIVFNSSFISSKSDKDGEKDWYKWANTESKNWGELVFDNTSQEGGFGSISKKENRFNLTTDISFYKSDIYKSLTHKPSAGIFYSFISGEESRDETTYIYSSPKTDNPFFMGDGDALVKGEQYLSKRLVYLPYKGNAALNYFGFYLEDIFYLDRLSLQTGLRLSYDDFLENINISPRLKASYNLLNNEKIVLYGGLNRYYSHGFLHQKLKEARGVTYLIERRSTYENYLQPFEKDINSPNKIYKFSNLKTPYSDEYSLGVKASILTADIDIKYIKKYFKNQFATGKGYDQNGYSIYLYNNSMESEFDSINLSLKKEEKQNYYIMFNISWQNRIAYVESYESKADEDTLSQRVYYDGEVIFRDEMPAKNYNQPIKANLIFYKRLPFKTDATSIIRYQNGYGIISNTYDDYEFIEDESNIDPTTGEPYKIFIPIYEDNKIEQRLTLDLKIETPFFTKNRFNGKIILNILNVFDNAKSVSSITSLPTKGRQFWAGFKFEF